MTKTKPIVVTGTGGSIGSHLLDRLVADRCTLRTLVHHHSGPRWGWLERRRSQPLSGLEVVRGDVLDPAQMRELVSGQETVCHLTALIGIPCSFQAPRTIFETNLMGKVNLLEAA